MSSRLSMLPVLRLSMPRTVAPSARRARLMLEPMNPAMPVMRAVDINLQTGLGVRWLLYQSIAAGEIDVEVGATSKVSWMWGVSEGEGLISGVLGGLAFSLRR